MNKKQITSPCISICKTDPRTGFCYGCGRTNEEKKIWKEEKTTVVWKEENVLKVSVPLYIKIKYKHKKLSGLDHLKSTLFKISIIERFSLLEFDSTNSIFEIHYYGNPKILKLELSKFNYKLKNDLGYWVISKK